MTPLLRYYGDPILRQRCKEVGEINDEIREIVEMMWEEFDRHTSVGLAANQCGFLWRIFLVRHDEYRRDGSAVKGIRCVYINPKLSNPSKETDWMNEPCLSIPGVRPPVERPVDITISALDADGKPFTEELHDYEARVRMHENDHLNGVLCVDRAPAKLRRIMEPKLREIKKRYH